MTPWNVEGPSQPLGRRFFTDDAERQALMRRIVAETKYKRGQWRTSR
jgi:hypothetical protein